MSGNIILLNGASSAGKSTLARVLQAVWILTGFDVFFVGVHCPLHELERRELARGDRRVGEARVDFETTHRFCTYDLELQSTVPVRENISELLAAWASRGNPSAFERMAQQTSGHPNAA